MTRLIIVYINFIIINLMLTGISSAKIDPKTAAGIWLFDEGSGSVTKDFSGNGNDGKLDGPTWVKGKFGNALEFDVGKFVDCGDGKSLSLGDADLTIGAWIKQNDLADYQIILTKGRPGVGTNKGYRLRIEDGGAPLFTVTGDTETDLKSGKPLPQAKEWWHVVGVKDAKNMTIYVNGEAWGARGDSPPGSSDNDVPLQIGRYPDVQWYFHGTLDEVFIFPVALSLDDIKTIMDKGFKSLASVSPSGKLATTWGQIK